MAMVEKTKPYHHGDLRHALLAAGLELVAERGVNGFTLREVARQAGVSHNAPYNHFADKAELVAALTQESFQQFAILLQASYDETPGSPLDKLRGMGQTYVRFAVDHPAQFRLMWRADLRESDKECDDGHLTKTQKDADAAGISAYDVLLNALSACQQAGLIQPGPVEDFALPAWSIVHGLAVLILDGPAEFAITTSIGIEALAGTMLDRLIEGLRRR